MFGTRTWTGKTDVYGHVSEDGPPIGWRCDIFPEKTEMSMVFQTEDDYIHYSF